MTLYMTTSKVSKWTGTQVVLTYSKPFIPLHFVEFHNLYGHYPNIKGQ